MEHQYSLQKYSGRQSRYKCPACGEQHQFARYVDNTTGEPLHDSCGKCNRADSCGLNHTPKDFFRDNPGSGQPLFIAQAKAPEPIKSISYIPAELYEQSGLDYTVGKESNFITWLQTLFTTHEVSKAISSYCIGSSDNWAGAVVFWQIGAKGKIHTGKVMQYDPLTGKRVKKPYNHINWIHSAHKLPEFNLQQCLFGSHLLDYYTNTTVAIVESEKTAILASILMPNYTWLSRGGKQAAKWRETAVHTCLIGRRVILFPDLADPAGKEKTPFELWSADAEILRAAGINVTVSRFLEDNATDTDRLAGADIADLLLRQHKGPT